MPGQKAWRCGCAWGLHTGEPYLATEGYVGLDVHHAARIMSAGHGGQVLLSQATRDLVEHALPEGVSLRDLGEHRLKDLQRPSHLYQLVMAGLPAEFPPLKTLDKHPHNLPIQLTPFIGRAREVATVQNLLRREDVRLVTLSGPGGSGKTRLGLQIAIELSDVFPDGVYFVNLAPISDPALVVSTIAQALAVKEIAGQSLLDLVKAFLREKHLLLLLDNFEQVISAAMQVTELLVACPSIKIIVTSRAVLHVRGEQEFAVPPLAVPDPMHLPDMVTLSQYEAVALFLQQAQAVKADFQITNATALAIAEICVRLDGLPLAIELAAARIKLFPPPALLARLGQRLAVLMSGARDAPARQQTLRDTIAWSYQLLDAQEQRLFRRLSVFVGGCTLEAAESVSAALGDAMPSLLEGVASLIDKNLLLQTAQEEEEPRFAMLETVREYGLECLHESGEEELSQRAHAEYYLSLAERVEPHLRGRGEQLKWLTLLKQEQENLRAALWWFVAHEETEQALRLCGATWWYWFMRGYYDEALRWLEESLVLPDTGKRTAARAQVLAATGLLIAIIKRDVTVARVLLEESIALYQELGDRRGYAHASQFLSYVYEVQDDYETARILLEQGLALCRELGDDWKVAFGLDDLARVMWSQGDTAAARALWEECLALSRKIGEIWGILRPLYWLAKILAVQGDEEQAMALAQEGLKIAREYGDMAILPDLLALQAEVLKVRDDVQAAHLVQEGLAIGRDMGDQGTISLFLRLMGDIAMNHGNIKQANEYYRESLSLALKQGGMKMTVGRCLLGLARVARTEGRIQSAARLFGAAEPWLYVNRGMAPVERATYDSDVAEARAHLGKEAFATIWAEGQTMTPEQALAVPEPIMMSQLIAGQPRKAQISKTPGSPASLSAREIEVLRLVAQGLTDAQVAAQLVISPRMVNLRLTSIYNKLEVDSRTAAARFAIEHHLV
jgi:predicted ATPase/DNA-binding CsgD family transcriptional regulator